MRLINHSPVRRLRGSANRVVCLLDSFTKPESGGICQLDYAKSNRDSGYSLIEVLIYLGLFVVLSSATAALFTQVVQLQAVSRARSQLSWQAEKVFLDMSQEIQASELIDSPLPGGNLDVLTLDGGLVQYQLAEGVLEKVAGGEVMALTTSPVVAEGLTFSNFSSVDNPGVQVRFTLRLPEQIPTMLEIVEEYQTSVFLRH